MEEWVREREALEQQLQSRVQITRSQQDVEAWERFVRQTARMRVVAEQLRAALPQEFAVENGLRVMFQGREIYLEHLVVGPSGIYLVESVEDSREWRDDLARSIEFFRKTLGSHVRYFACLVVAREPAGIDQLPQGANLLDSLESAVQIIRDAEVSDPLPAAVSKELWHIIRAMAPRPQVPAQQPVPLYVPASTPRRGFTWREWVTILSALGFVVVIVVPGGGAAGLIGGLMLYVLPVAGLAGLTLLFPEPVRTGCSWVLMILALLTFLIFLSV